MTHFARKHTLRQELSASRRGRPAAAREADSARIVATLCTELADIGTTVAAYVPVGAEPGGDLPGTLLERGFAVLLPVLLADGDLDWATCRSTTDLAPAGRGLREPLGPRLGTDAIRTADAVVVPAVAVGLDGSRLGRGGGSYDRALTRVSADTPVVALVYDDELVDSLPTEAHDVQVNAVVTPSRGWLDLPAAFGLTGSG
ncbi:5-formyltetrahydrofolate cyclo-ligase [Fodinicola acaciae]|uniref:5-formyltetrahydrofolate cyclo-ligase n=1 Tax=Fodinicola acaciae TaxID=2681555 RepID=UPI0013D18405|nr:5-formyltetrahydrofolate cyclo-ligase [Fodinicola acaciae]